MQLISRPDHGSTICALDTMYPSLLRVVRGSGDVGHVLHGEGDETSTTYGFVVSGSVRLHPGSVRPGPLHMVLEPGCFFAAPGHFSLTREHVLPEVSAAAAGSRVEDRILDEFSNRSAGEPVVVLIKRYGYRSLLHVGRIEEKGRLSYIDGCSDTMLVPPARLGDPVLNHLHFPAGVVQTQHTHPSIRLGVVVRGHGKAFRRPATPDSEEGWEHALVPGAVFLLEEQELHSFRTDDFTPIRNDGLLVDGVHPGMDVIAYHPDSDWGPTDGNHPMLNRTYIHPQAPGARGA